MVNIQSAIHPNSGPTFNYDIEINGVTISLTKETFQELVTKLGDKIETDYKNGIQYYTEFWNKKRVEREFLNWLDATLSECYSKNEPLSMKTTGEIFQKLIDILY